MKHVDVDALNTLHGCVEYLSQLTFMSRKNRNNPTDAEKKMWNEVLPCQREKRRSREGLNLHVCQAIVGTFGGAAFFTNFVVN